MSADVDLAKAIMARWSSSAAVTSQVPGGLQTDMLTGDQDAAHAFENKERPYAKLELAMDRDPEFSSGGDRIEFHKVTLTVWGLGRESMGPGRRILLLTPASVGSRWFADHVWGHALVLALSPRLTFVGETHPYPSDLILSVYDPEMERGFAPWRWRT